MAVGINLATDNFTRADAPNLGANWTIGAAPSAAIQIVSNTARTTALTTSCNEEYTAVSFPSDHSTRAKIGVLNTPGAAQSNEVAAQVRAATGAQTFYQGGIIATSTGNQTIIEKAVAGVFTTLVSGTTALGAGAVLEVTVWGSNLALAINGSAVLSTTDASIATGSPGLYLYTDVATTDVTATYWEAGVVVDTEWKDFHPPVYSRPKRFEAVYQAAAQNPLTTWADPFLDLLINRQSPELPAVFYRRRTPVYYDSPPGPGLLYGLDPLSAELSLGRIMMDMPAVYLRRRGVSPEVVIQDLLGTLLAPPPGPSGGGPPSAFRRRRR